MRSALNGLSGFEGWTEGMRNEEYHTPDREIWGPKTPASRGKTPTAGAPASAAQRNGGRGSFSAQMKEMANVAKGLPTGEGGARRRLQDCQRNGQPLSFVPLYDYGSSIVSHRTRCLLRGTMTVSHLSMSEFLARVKRLVVGPNGDGSDLWYQCVRPAVKGASINAEEGDHTGQLYKVPQYELAGKGRRADSTDWG